eukprot:3319924-Prymnesium_polylepis.2
MMWCVCFLGIVFVHSTSACRMNGVGLYGTVGMQCAFHVAHAHTGICEQLNRRHRHRHRGAQMMHVVVARACVKTEKFPIVGSDPDDVL